MIFTKNPAKWGFIPVFTRRLRTVLTYLDLSEV